MPRVKGSVGNSEVGAHLPNPPRGCQFGVAKMWENLPLYEGARGGKTIFVQVEKDEEISPEASLRYLNLCRKVNRNVSAITFTSPSKWKHADNFYSYEAPRRTFMRAVFTE